MANRLNVLVTGACGFVGGNLFESLRDNPSFRVSGSVRSVGGSRAPGLFAVGNIDSGTDWTVALRNQNVVVHTAARVHVMMDETADPLAAFREVNVVGTLNLARQAAEAGVRRFIFISSIKVNGEMTPEGVPFTAGDIPAPQDPYGISKLEAEQALWHISEETGMEIVIIRPPLVYGPGVKGNFASIIRLVAKGFPLPFGAVNNRRSLVALDNLLNLIIRCIDHPYAANQVFLVSDGEDFSTSQLLRCVSTALDKPLRLIWVPVGVLQLGASLLGKKAMAQRLLGSLQVDISKTRELLSWEPPLSVDEGLRRCCRTGRDL